jgi:hypothetical protein
MGVGRNLAYRKNIFLESKGFKGYYQVVGGDDDLFVNRHAHRRNTKSVLDPESIVYSIPKTNLSSYAKQKIRHLSVGRYYRFRHRLKIGIFAITKLLMWLSFFWLLFIHDYYLFAIASWGIYMSLSMLQFQLSSKKLGDQFEIYLVPLLDLLYVLSLLGFGVVARFRKRIAWI